MAAPVGIFTSSAGVAPWRLLRESIWLLAPFVLIAAIEVWAIHPELELDRASRWILSRASAPSCLHLGCNAAPAGSLIRA